MKLFDPNGVVAGENDDIGSNRDSSLAHAAAHTGNYRLLITDRYGQGSERSWYHLTVRNDQPDFELHASADSLIIPTDKPAEFPVKVQRRGIPGDAIKQITIQAVDLPEGVTVAPVVSEPTGPTAGEVKLSFASTGKPFSGPIRISGKATEPREIERFARCATNPTVDFCFKLRRLPDATSLKRLPRL
jgi:hypothetical protein